MLDKAAELPAHNPPSQRITFAVTALEAGLRLDKYLALQLPTWSRTQVQRLLHEGQVHTSQTHVVPSYRVHNGECIVVDIPPPRPTHLVADVLPLSVIYDEVALLVWI